MSARQRPDDRWRRSAFSRYELFGHGDHSSETLTDIPKADLQLGMLRRIQVFTS
jgi:hypothetical protein